MSVLCGKATGLQYRHDAVSAVSAVRYVPAADGDQVDEGSGVLAADFVVEAMGRSSRLSNWLTRDGYDQPRLERLEAPINYATALFERPVKFADLEQVGALAR